MIARSVLEFSSGAAGPLLAGDGERDLSWRDAALCAQADPDAWFPERGESNLPAKRICAACEVRAECLDFALENGERFGIWGGTSEAQRRRILSARSADPPRRCRSGRHPMEGANIIAFGGCLACRKEREASQRPAAA